MMKQLQKYIALPLFIAAALTSLAFSARTHRHPHPSPGSDRATGSTPHGESVPHEALPLPAPRGPSMTPSASGLPPGPTPMEPPPSPPWEVDPALGALTQDQLEQEIRSIAETLDKRTALERLNRNEVKEDERKELGALIREETLLKQERARRALQDLNARLAEYEQHHAERLAHFGAGKKPFPPSTHHDTP